jgi:F-type H+-transporting ATPase subunit delta
MLRHAARRLAGSGIAASRCLSTAAVLRDEGTKQTSNSIEEFKEQFLKVVPSNMDPPKFPSDYIKKKDKAADTAGVPDKLTFNFYLPHEQISDGEEVDLVLIPAVTGDFGAMPGHVPTVAQLRPGVVTVHKELDKDISKYFVSGGYAFVHNDSTADVVAVEAFKLDELDPDAVRAGLQEYTAKLASLQGKADDYEIAAAQIGVEVYSAMNSAVGG